MELDDTLYIWYNQMNLRTESAPPSSTQSLTNIIEEFSMTQQFCHSNGTKFAFDEKEGA